MLKLRLLRGQAPYGTARTGAGGAELGPGRAASSPAKGGTAYLPAPAISAGTCCQQPAQLPGALPPAYQPPHMGCYSRGAEMGLGSGAKSLAGRAEPWLAQPSTRSPANRNQPWLARTHHRRAGTCPGWLLLPSSDDLELNEPQSLGTRVLNLKTTA